MPERHENVTTDESLNRSRAIQGDRLTVPPLRVQARLAA